ncbi:unnamed protein product [Musa hybrid cultivar]
MEREILSFSGNIQSSCSISGHWEDLIVDQWNKGGLEPAKERPSTMIEPLPITCSIGPHGGCHSRLQFLVVDLLAECLLSDEELEEASLVGLGKIAKLINAGKFDSLELITMKTLNNTGAMGKQIEDGVRLMTRGPEQIISNDQYT